MVFDAGSAVSVQSAIIAEIVLSAVEEGRELVGLTLQGTISAEWEGGGNQSESADHIPGNQGETEVEKLGEQLTTARFAIQVVVMDGHKGGVIRLDIDQRKALTPQNSDKDRIYAVLYGQPIFKETYRC